MERVVCSWCGGQSEPGRSSCEVCGAPLDQAALVSDSGWREAPRLRDMEEFTFGTSTCQVEGEIVPVAELNLGDGDSMFFEHHVLLWKDENVPVSAMNTGSRSFGGMPFVVTVAQGPGRIAVSRDAPGEMVVLPMHPSMEIDIREHAFLAASSSISYSFYRIKGLTNILHGGSGMYMDRFITQGGPGLLLLHGNGNVFERNLAAGEKLIVEPGAFLFKDSSVTMNTVQLPVKTGLLRRGMYMAEMVGPGRLGIQSMYVHHGSD
ncbi:MAG: AIM24 family protein [Ilumatobacteraceae bacterium]